MTDRIDDIEVRIAFLEQANADLNDTVIRQQQELKALHARLDSLLQRLEAAQSQPTAWSGQDEKPPHY